MCGNCKEKSCCKKEGGCFFHKMKKFFGCKCNEACKDGSCAVKAGETKTEEVKKEETTA